MGYGMLTATINGKNASFYACNPSNGGSAKGKLSLVIDALSGEMAKVSTRPTSK